MSFHIDDLSAVPHKPGVYFFYDKKGSILYIGKAKDLKNRVKQYFAPGSLWKQDMLAKAEKIDFAVVTSESEALYLEDNLIKKHKPFYNSLLKADNSYVYIKISHEPFPAVFSTRYKVNDGSLYLGPKHNTRELHKLLQFVRQLFCYRTCSASVFNQGKVCSDYHFGVCKGRCAIAALQKAHNLSKKRQTTPLQNIQVYNSMTYEEAILENKKRVKLLVNFFAGKTTLVEDEVMGQMKQAVAQEHFEYAAKLRDIYTGIAGFTEKQHVVITQTAGGKAINLKTVTGKIMKIKEMEGRFVVAIVHLFEGKMIDIIRVKYRTSDTERGDIISDFRTEYGEAIVKIGEPLLGEYEKGMSSSAKIDRAKASSPEDTAKQILVMTPPIHKVGKKILVEIESLLDRFIDAFVASSTFEKENIMSDLLQGLQARYGFPRFPYNVECVDISHMSGSRASGAVVSMKEGLLNKKGYRRYKIQTATTGDDYEALREVLIRKFRGMHMDDGYVPDIFILDGGKGQLGVVKSLYEEKERFRTLAQRVYFCSLGKGAARKRAGKALGEKEALYWFCNGNQSGTLRAPGKIDSLSLQYDDVDRLFLSLRDEAHRFSNQYRIKQMSMEWKDKKPSRKKKGE